MYNPFSSLLVGEVKDDDKIYQRDVKSLRGNLLF